MRTREPPLVTARLARTALPRDASRIRPARPHPCTRGASRTEASLQVGVADRTVEEAEGSCVEQLPTGPLQHAQRGAGQAAAQADPLDAEREERGRVGGAR